MAYPSNEVPGRRTARLMLLMVGLWILALAFLILAVLLALSPSPTGTVAFMPVPVAFSRPAGGIVFAALAASGAVLVGLAAMHAAAAMRVLERDRRLPTPMSSEVRRRATHLLGPAAVARFQLDREIETLPSAIPPSGPVGPVRLTVLVPAYNEELTIAATLSSLRDQTRRPDRVVVVADNCTDATAAIAPDGGAEVFTTEENTEKKAGALNQALGRLLPGIDVRDVIMVMDADSIIVPEFLATALGRLESDQELMAVGGCSTARRAAV